MAKRANLNAALSEVTPPPADVQKQPAARRRSAPVIPSREGTVLIGAHLPARYAKAMKILSAETGETQRTLFEEALNMLFVKKGAKRLGVDV